jgi:hypothetical protein
MDDLDEPNDSAEKDGGEELDEGNAREGGITTFRKE